MQEYTLMLYVTVQNNSDTQRLHNIENESKNIYL